MSPIVAGAAIKGPADRLLVELGHESSVVGVARLYAPLAATLVVDEADAGLAGAVEAEGMRCVVAPTVMHGPAEAERCRWPQRSLPRRPSRVRHERAPMTASRSSRSRACPRCDPATCSPTSSPARVELRDGDVLVVTQKVVSKAEGRLVAIDPDDIEARSRARRARVGARAAAARRPHHQRDDARLRVCERRRRPLQRGGRAGRAPARRLAIARPAASATACAPAPASRWA